MATVTHSKREKRCRKALLGLGLVPVEGVYRVTMKRGGGKTYVVDQAEVYKYPDANSYTVFGEGTVMNALAPQRQTQVQLSQSLPTPFEVTPELMKFNDYRMRQQEALFAQEQALPDTQPQRGPNGRLNVIQQASGEPSIQGFLSQHQQAQANLEWLYKCPPEAGRELDGSPAIQNMGMPDKY